MDIINMTCGEIESAVGFVYVILPVILNHTRNGDCEQSWFIEDQCVADPDNPHRLMDPASSVSPDRLVTSRCVNLIHEIVCDASGTHHSHKTMYRVRNETAVTPNPDVKEVTPPLQLSDQWWWLLAVFIVLLIVFLMCLIQRKRIFRKVRFICQCENDSENRDPESAVQTEIRSDARDSLNQPESEQLNDYLSRR